MSILTHFRDFLGQHQTTTELFMFSNRIRGQELRLRKGADKGGSSPPLNCDDLGLQKG